MSLPNIFSRGKESVQVYHIQKSENRQIRTKWNNFSFSYVWIMGRGRNDFPFHTTCEVWVLINFTFEFIFFYGHIRMRMKPAPWEGRGRCGKHLSPFSQGCAYVSRSRVW